MKEPQTTESKVSLREKFRIKPLEIWELAPYECGGIACWRGTYRTFGFRAAITQFSPLVNFIVQMCLGFPYRHYSLVVNEDHFKFSDGRGCSVTPQIIDGGKQ